VLHVVAIAVVIVTTRHRLWEPSYFTLTPLEPVDAPPLGGRRAGAGRPGGVRPAAPDARPVRPPSPEPVATQVVPPTVVPTGIPGLAGGPRLGDGRLWVDPRPALPAPVAEALYGEAEHQDSVAVRRLRAMVDSLNVLLDEAQRERQRPTWTTEVAGTTFGVDSQYIHVAGVKIPTTALALLPIRLPQGNYGEMERAEQLAEMREDIMRSAQRTENLRDFRRYVRELRARKQAERDAERRAREQAKDTVKVVP
jgi:hypothetical protein